MVNFFSSSDFGFSAILQSTQVTGNNINSRGNGIATATEVLWKIDALQKFINDLHWPDDIFASHLEHRLKLMAADMIQSIVSR